MLFQQPSSWTPASLSLAIGHRFRPDINIPVDFELSAEYKIANAKGDVLRGRRVLDRKLDNTTN
jgi:hypothetical protein